MASLIMSSWNRVSDWLERVETLREHLQPDLQWAAKTLTSEACQLYQPRMGGPCRCVLCF
jgi:hypothetical protein